jgi:NADH-quinone oxidoreductase subunit E
MEKYFQKELLEELHELRETYGYIPEEDIVRIAQRRNIPKAHLYGVISFYSMFHLKPTGKYIIKVCDSVSCRIAESESVIDAIIKFTKVTPGNTSEDKKFTLEVAECLGHCGEGPVMTINGEFYTYLTPQKVVNILKTLD